MRLQPNDIIQNRYRVERLIGRGGMGAVYLVEDRRLPGRHWALKEMVCYDPAIIEHAREAFTREARMLASLRHRNLPVIVDYFSADESQFLVMEHIEGENMARLVEQEGPSSETEVLRWALELAQVLDYLHRQERPVIFRDLKPENIMVTTDRHLKLVDFGLARHFEPGKERDTHALASVGYAPPEQWDDLSQTDERSDIYSLGATLFYALTGKPPSPIYGSHRIRPHRPDIDSGLEALVLRCLQPEPHLRYLGTGELIRDILLLLSRGDGHKELHSLQEETGPYEGEKLPDLPPPRPLVRWESPRWVPVLLLLATFLFLTGAALGWRSATSARPQSTEGMFEVLQLTREEKESARRAIDEGRYQEAITILDSLVTRYSADAEAHILKSNAYALLSGQVDRIPVLIATSGRDVEGFQLLHGLALAQQEVNREGGGRKGRPIVLDILDTGSELEPVLQLAREVTSDRRYAIGIGPFTSQHAIALAPILDSAGIAFISPCASDPRVWKAGRYTFTAADSDTPRVRVLAQHLAGRGYRKALVLWDEENMVSRSGADDFTSAFQSAGGSVVESRSYRYDTADLEPLAREIAWSGADCVFLAEYRTPMVVRFAASLSRHRPRLPLATLAATYSHDLVQQGGDSVEGLVTSTYFHPEASDAAVRSFTRRFQEMFGDIVPSHREANAYDTLMLLVTAIRHAGFERAPLRDYIASLGETRGPYQGVTGEFAPARQLERRKVYVLEIRGGRFQLVD
ncbi:MAG: ABC transporter substrate-binding protein [Armatimonadetes bacterium]|nr:ABC transporter substrate-binding protein [Armatimonadota bacterium]